MLAPNTILQNRYRVVRELGHGGMGTVYEAIDQRVNCVVALKQTAVNSDREARTAFEREAALLANLRHQALPKVMDYFSESDGDFLVMEFIPGHDLAELLELRGAPFPQEQVLQWADSLLKVLGYLHDQNPPILHRDIKPANLKLTMDLDIAYPLRPNGNMHAALEPRETTRAT
jgi:serine/threonine protein kinase